MPSIPGKPVLIGKPRKRKNRLTSQIESLLRTRGFDKPKSV